MNKKSAIRLALLVAVVLAAYFINVEVNTHLGKKVLSESGLEIHSLDDALVKARTDSKLVLADLSAIWCPNCRKLDKQVFSDDTVRRVISEDYIFARVEYETEEGKAFKQRYGVQGFPNVLVLDGQGQLLKQVGFTLDPKQFINNLKQ